MHAFTELRESKKTDASSWILVFVFFLSLSLSLCARSAFVCACVCVTALSLSSKEKKRKTKKAKKESGRKDTFGRENFLFVCPHPSFFSSPQEKKGKIDEEEEEEEEEEKVASLHFSERERAKEKRREEKPKVAERFVSARVERRVVCKYFYERAECSVRRLSRGTDRKSEKAKRVPSLPPLLSTTR